MSGEINATKVVISDGTDTIVGQGEFTTTFGGVPIDISNKSYDDFITYLDGELATKQVVFAGTLTYNNDATFIAVRAAALAGTLGTYTISYAASGETISGQFMPNAMSDTVGMGAKLATAITFSSSGEYTHAPATPAP